MTRFSGSGSRLYRNGICTGHKDTDDLIARNRVRGNAKHGIYVSGVTHDLVVEANTIRETRAGDQRHQRHAVYLAAGVTRVTIVGNTLAGHPDSAIVDDSQSPTNQLQTG